MRNLYVVKSGTVHKGTGKVYFGCSRFFTSHRKARLEMNDILTVNRGKAIKDEVPMETIGELKRLTYLGEEAKYKGVIIIERHILN